MGRLEVSCRRFALLSGIAQDATTYVSCVQPRGVGGRKGLLTLVTEPAGDHPGLSTGACGLVHEALVRHYYSDNSLSLTSGLLKALDAANGALLRYNYADEAAPAATGTDGAVAVQTGGGRSRRSQVGLTAALLRPDGDGIYLAQMLPTQAYVLHQGHVSALPEPASWQRPGKVAVTLRRVPDPDAESEDAEPFDDDSTLPTVTLPSTPLGSAPGVEVDLLYRRVEPGDLIAIVSSSLARQLDRSLAEEIFASGSADAAIDALYMIATERGLAQAHACVLQIGVDESSGVDADLPESLTSEPSPTDLEPQPATTTSQAPVRLDVLKAPRLWLSRLRPAEVEPPQVEADTPDDGRLPLASHEPTEGLLVEPEHHEDEPEIWTEHPSNRPAPNPPTQILLQGKPDLPPYQATGDQEGDGPIVNGELDFDGWEDVPPALAVSPAELRNKPSPKSDDQDAPHAAGEGQSSLPVGRQSATRPRLYSVPTIFDEEDEEDEEFPPAPAPALPIPPASRAQGMLDKVLPVGQKAAIWAGNTLRSLLPDSLSAHSTPTTQSASKRNTWRPRRELIAAGVAVLFLLLAFSVYTMTSNPRHTEVNQFLSQAQQEDLLANQPSTPASERQGHLNKVIELATQALQVEPGSTEATRLLSKAQATLDTVQGIKRFSPKLLFDLEDPNQPGGAQNATLAANSQAVTSTGHLAEIVVTGNDAYVLDSERERVYRCHIATNDCTAILKVGDDLGGQKVGSLVDMTLRVGNPVVLDNNFVTFAFSPDTSAWQPQQLGGADQLAKPKDIATYDGNLYLLDATPSQVSKYAVGQFAQPPVAWISDQSSVDQVKDSVSLGIDGAIYVLLADGRILVMQGGKVTRTIAPTPGDTNPPTQLFTGTDTQDLYLLTSKSASLSRMSKEGQVRLTLKPTADSGISELTGISVDEGNGKFYMLSGRKVYEADLRPSTSAPANATQPDQPSSRPTAEP